MSEFITVILIMIMSYVIGNFNLSYFLSKLKGYDIRQHGSGNAGAYDQRRRGGGFVRGRCGGR